jgi:DNA polymerase III subunit delta
MQTISNDHADSFVAKPPQQFRAFLIRGQDEGLVSERSRTLAKALAEFAGADAEIVRIEGDRLSLEPDAYVSVLYGASLFGGARIVVVQIGGRDVLRALEPAVRSPSPDAFLIVEAADLRKDRDVALRDLFGAAKLTALIECKSDDKVSIGRLIEEQARQHNVDVSAEARAALIDLLGPDRLSNRNELEKLFLYGLNAPKISLTDVEAIVTGQDQSPLEDALEILLSGDSKVVQETLASFHGQFSDLQAFPFKLVLRLVQLMKLSEAMSQGQSFQQAMRDTGVWVSGPMIPTLQRQAERWRPATLRRLVPALFRFLARMRQQNRLSGILLERFLWNLTSSTR